MNDNNFLTIELYDPIRRKVIRSYIVYSNYNTKIEKAVEDFIDGKSVKDESLLKDVFGSKWKSIIGGNSGGDDDIDSLYEQSVQELISNNNITGGIGISDDFDEADIANLLQDDEVKNMKSGDIIGLSSGNYASAITEPGKEVIGMSFSLDDTILDLRMKLATVLGLPFYRMHFGWFDGSNYHTPYRLSLDGPIEISIDDYAKRISNQLFGINIDMDTYRGRNNIIVRSFDQFTLTSSLLGKRIILVDMNLFINKLKMRVTELATDRFQFDMLYYGFIILYWPHMTYDAFTSYMRGERDFLSTFPDMNSISAATMNSQKEILSKIDKSSQIELIKTITSIYYYVDNPGCIMKLRNIFDSLHLSKELFYTRVSLEIGSSLYSVDKRFTMTKQPTIPNISIFRHGLIIVFNLLFSSEIDTTMILHILQNGRYYVKVQWPDTSMITFEKSTQIINRVLSSFFKFLNSNSFYVGDFRLRLPTQRTTKYQSVNANFSWSRVLSDSEFHSLNQILSTWTRAKLINVKPINERGSFDLSWIHGTFQYDHSTIERVLQNITTQPITNYYSFFTNSTVKQKWIQNYAGRPTKMIHRTSDIRFEFTGIREEEFIKIERYLKCFVWYCQVTLKQKGENISLGSMKKLKRLKEGDRELFDIKQQGASKVYSVKCQSERQPNLFTDDEVSSMSAADKKYLQKYWNFTYNRTAYYSCSKEFPHLSFIVGVHPKGYCLPCCKKAEIKENTRREEITKKCLLTHRWEDNERLLSKHIIKFGKFILPGRYSGIHNLISEFFKGTIDTKLTPVLAGVDQSNAVFNALCYLYEVDSAHMIKGLTTAIKQDNNFDSLLGGKILEYFSDKDSLISALSRQDSMIGSPMNNLFFELAAIASMGLILITVIDKNIVFYINKTNAPKYSILVAFSTEETRGNTISIEPIAGLAVYPITLIEKVTGGDFKSVKRLWHREDSLIKRFIHTIETNNLSLDKTMLLDGISDSGIKINKVFAGRYNRIYAAELNDKTIIPIDYDNDTSAVTKNIKIIHDETPSTNDESVKIIHADRLFTIPKAGTVEDKLNKLIISLPTGAIKSKLPPRISKLAARGYYFSRLYELFLSRVFRVFETDRDETMRAKIITAVKSNNKSTLNTLLAQFPEDLSIVLKLLSDVYYEDITISEFEEQFKGRIFMFDRKSIQRLKSGETNIETLANQLCVEKPFEGTEFPNTYDACLDSFCENGKLIVDPSVGINELCRVFNIDLLNGDRLNYLSETILTKNVIDQFKFRRSKEEILNIKRL